MKLHLIDYISPWGSFVLVLPQVHTSFSVKGQGTAASTRLIWKNMHTLNEDRASGLASLSPKL